MIANVFWKEFRDLAQWRSSLCACRWARVVVELCFLCVRTSRSKDADRWSKSFAQRLVGMVDSSDDDNSATNNITMCDYHRVCDWVQCFTGYRWSFRFVQHDDGRHRISQASRSHHPKSEHDLRRVARISTHAELEFLLSHSPCCNEKGKISFENMIHLNYK